ncbi:MAG: PAS domain S-box protein [Candidatus Auribacterota bacterium]|nr:PAS domain S-box protein [Candidatus Auribacterota bacterium]
MTPTKNKSKKKSDSKNPKGKKPVKPRKKPVKKGARVGSRKEEKDHPAALAEVQRELNCRFTEAGVLTHVNQAYCRYFGKKAKELLGKNYFSLLPKKDRADIRRRLTALTPENPVITYEQKIKSSGRKIRWQQYSIRAVFDKSGKIVEFLAVGRDITESKHSEESLRESEERYRAVVEDQIELVCRYRPDGTLTFVNQSYCRHYGKNRDDLIGKKFLSFLSESDRKKFFKLVKSTTKKRPLSIQIQGITKKNGEKLWQEWHRQALFDSSGKLVEFQSVGRDITERINAEEALKQSERVLRRQKKELEQKNVALKEIMELIAREKQQIKDEVIANIDELLLPIIARLKLEVSGADHGQIDILERTLQQLGSSFGKKITQSGLNLTQREIEICNLIKNGFSSKEIAGFLHIALNTIGRHRNNIRKKAGIANKKIRLSTFLLNL